MDIRDDVQGVLEIFNSLSISERKLISNDGNLDESNVVVRKVLYIENEPICFMEIFVPKFSKTPYLVVATKEQYRQLGYSKFLSNLIEEENLKNKTYKDLYWCVNINNIPSINLCKSLGFKELKKGFYIKNCF